VLIVVYRQAAHDYVFNEVLHCYYSLFLLLQLLLLSLLLSLQQARKFKYMARWKEMFDKDKQVLLLLNTLKCQCC
jgi:hypothetical protein